MIMELECIDNWNIEFKYKVSLEFGVQTFFNKKCRYNNSDIP